MAQRTLEVRHERVFLVGLQDGAEEPDRSMAELARLAESDDAVIVGRLIQRRKRPDSALFLGKGKVDELGALCRREGADLAIFNHELTPAQQRNLEKALEVGVIDRTALVLDIFAQRARTREGRLQVELAQLSYLLPRLTGRADALSRLGGGIGTRGPGETKLEVDRRRIRSRMTSLQHAIDEIRRTRLLQRESRRQAQLPVVALVGYTNAGKSTLLNALTNARVFVQDKLFATLDPTVRKVTLPDHRAALLVDTVGFITHLPPQLIAAFRATLEEVTAADLLVHVVDAHHPAWKDQIEAVDEVLNDLGAGEKPVVYAVNKSDRVPAAQANAVLRSCGGPGATISALRGVGLINLLRKIALELPEPMVRVRLQVPYARVRALYDVFAHGRVLHEEYAAGGVSVEAELPRLDAERVQRFLRDGFSEDRSTLGRRTGNRNLKS